MSTMLIFLHHLRTNGRKHNTQIIKKKINVISGPHSKRKVNLEHKCFPTLD